MIFERGDSFSIDLHQRRVVVVGAAVPAEAVAQLVQQGAAVRIIAPSLDAELIHVAQAGNAQWCEREYRGREDLVGAWLVVMGSGDAALDDAVAQDARAHQIPTARPTARQPRPAAAAPEVARGHVTLVGAGPGGDGLLTLAGAAALAHADVVVVDRLAPTCAAGMPSHVEVIDVGKQPGRETISQEHINQLLVRHARAGRAVVRLKGGDSFVFGRGGEERDYCRSHGVPVSVIAGVTSATSVPAAAGIPLTHRGLSRGFTVVTGHDEVPQVPTASGHTIVVLMGIAQLARTCEALMARGIEASRPAAIIEAGYSAQQRVTFATVESLAHEAQRVHASSPAVIVIGEVVTLAPDYRPPQPVTRDLGEQPVLELA